MLTALVGLAAGAAHALSGPDHLAAIAPLTLGRGRAGWRSGAVWGGGHTLGVWAAGGLVLGLREIVPLSLISSWSDRLVGAGLVAVGLWAVRRALHMTVHVHTHDHDGRPHTHLHGHGPSTIGHDQRRHRHAHVAGAFGVLHGLAGSAGVLGVLPLLALPSTADAVLYLTFFGAGSIVAMAGVGGAIGLLSERARGAMPRVLQSLVGASGVAAVGVGAVWLLT